MQNWKWKHWIRWKSPWADTENKRRKATTKAQMEWHAHGKKKDRMNKNRTIQTQHTKLKHTTQTKWITIIQFSMLKYTQNQSDKRIRQNCRSRWFRMIPLFCLGFVNFLFHFHLARAFHTKYFVICFEASLHLYRRNDFTRSTGLLQNLGCIRHMVYNISRIRFVNRKFIIIINFISVLLQVLQLQMNDYRYHYMFTTFVSIVDWF